MSNQTTFPAGSFKSVPFDMMNTFDINLTQCCIYAVMRDDFLYWRSLGKVYSPSESYIASKLGVSRPTVNAAIKKLVCLGLVKVDFEQKGLSTHYTVFCFSSVETQQEPPLEAPETLSNEVNVPNQPNTIASPVKDLTELPTKPAPIEETEPMSTPEQNKPVKNIPRLQDIPETSNLVIPQRYNDYRNRVYPSSYVPHSRHDHYEEEPF